jgi:hypothetical protein
MRYLNLEMEVYAAGRNSATNYGKEKVSGTNIGYFWPSAGTEREKVSGTNIGYFWKGKGVRNQYWIFLAFRGDGS